MVRDGDEPFAILSVTWDPDVLLPGGPAPAGGREACYLLPPVVFDLAGRVIEGQGLLMAIAWGVQMEIPMLFNKDPGDLADIDQRHAAMRDHFGAQPWPPLEPWDYSPPGTPQ